MYLKTRLKAAPAGMGYSSVIRNVTYLCSLTGNNDLLYKDQILLCVIIFCNLLIYNCHKCKDCQTHDPVNGRVIINNSDVGGTNTPFTYTFNSSHYTAKVVASNYPETPLYFHVNNSLEVRAVPNTIDLSQSGNTSITIFANYSSNSSTS